MKIKDTPQIGWCIVCMKAWQPDMVAVQLRRDDAPICGDCIARAATMIVAEQQRRAEIRHDR